MKIALSQLNFTVGDFEGNKTKIIDSINSAKQQGVDLVVFAEQAISGTPAYDLLNKVTFLDMGEEALVEIASFCDGISVLVGLPIPHNNKTISVAAFIQDRKIVRYVGKQNIVSRDEVRHLSQSKGCEYITVGEHKVAVVLGLDIVGESEFGDYADTIVVMSASKYARGIIADRYEFFKRKAFETGKNVVFVNHVGGQADIVYDGSSCVVDNKGNLIALSANFTEDLTVVDFDAPHEPLQIPPQDKTVNVYRAMKLGLKDYFAKSGFKKACLGLSGGIDSAVVLAVAAEVLGAKNVRVLMMPSQFSTDHSVEDAVKMAEGLGVEYNVVPITDAYKAVNDTMKPVLGGTKFDVTEENIQSRLRMTMLMALSNKFGYIVLNTSNKSELAVGYSTMYGDCIGAFSITGDLYKVEIYDLARHLNRKGEIIPVSILEKEPSAELRPEQKDSDSLPAYDVLDAIIYRMIEEGQHREEIINAGFDADTVYKVYSLIKANEYKRYQFCPTLRLSTCTFGKGRIMPLVSKYGF